MGDAMHDQNELHADKLSRIAFVVLKFKFSDDYFYLLRRNEKWHDLNFIGGHENERDRGSLRRAADRELKEEVPSSRNVQYSLSELTSILEVGPYFSRSAQKNVLYNVQFFLVGYLGDPTQMLASMSRRSKNRLVAQAELIKSSPAISRFALLLNSEFTGGIIDIPLSWRINLGPVSQYGGLLNSEQLDLNLR
jgi:hypothetical protein